MKKLFFLFGICSTVYAFAFDRHDYSNDMLEIKKQIMLGNPQDKNCYDRIVTSVNVEADIDYVQTHGTDFINAYNSFIPQRADFFYADHMSVYNMLNTISSIKEIKNPISKLLKKNKFYENYCKVDIENIVGDNLEMEAAGYNYQE